MLIARLNDAPEIFYSLQGEGASVGTPSIFIRLFGCNLACSWCDTSYAWGKSQPACRMAEIDIIHAIRQYPCRHIVLTGGEPLIQQKSLTSLVKQLTHYTIEVETNGTIIPDAALDTHITQYNISPKLTHANNNAVICKKTLSHFTHHHAAKSWFKFVVNSQDDIQSINDLAAECSIQRSQIILMPQASTRLELEKKRIMVANLARQHGLRFSDRLHITLWGEKKGV